MVKWSAHEHALSWCLLLLLTFPFNQSGLGLVDARAAMQQLYEDLLFNYVPEVRPSKQPLDVTLVTFSAFLIQILDLNEKSQIFKTNLWLEMHWKDHRLSWDPSKYANITRIHVPAVKIWIPDIVVYNNAAGAPEITIYTEVFAAWDGTVVWKPPMLGNSFCKVDVAKFPYDEQNCFMKFGTWSYDAESVDLGILRFYEALIEGQNTTVKNIGMDLSYYYRSAEWDILNVSAVRHEVVYKGCCGQKKYVDITFNFHLRRLPLFYSANMMLPCGLIGILSMLAYVLPPDSKQRMTLSISILVSLCVFFLLLVEIMPATSAGIPIMGKYILFNMVSISTTIAITTITLNLHHRSRDFPMSSILHWIILEKLGAWMEIGGQTFRQEVAQKAREHANTLKSTNQLTASALQYTNNNHSKSINHKSQPSSAQMARRKLSQFLPSPMLLSRAAGISKSHKSLVTTSQSNQQLLNQMEPAAMSNSQPRQQTSTSTPAQSNFSSNHNLDETSPGSVGCNQRQHSYTKAAFVACGHKRSQILKESSSKTDNRKSSTRSNREKQPVQRSKNSLASQAADHADTERFCRLVTHPELHPRMEIVLKTLNNAIYVGEYFKFEYRRELHSSEWRIVAMVIDRVCMWLYTALTFAVNVWFVLQLPSLWDNRQPLSSPIPNSPLGYAALCLDR